MYKVSKHVSKYVDSFSPTGNITSPPIQQTRYPLLLFITQFITLLLLTHSKYNCPPLVMQIIYTVLSTSGPKFCSVEHTKRGVMNWIIYQKIHLILQVILIFLHVHFPCLIPQSYSFCLQLWNFIGQTETVKHQQETNYSIHIYVYIESNIFLYAS